MTMQALSLLQKFVDYYPSGINPELDAVYREARAELARRQPAPKVEEVRYYKSNHAWYAISNNKVVERILNDVKVLPLGYDVVDVDSLLDECAAAEYEAAKAKAVKPSEWIGTAGDALDKMLEATAGKVRPHICGDPNDPCDQDCLDRAYTPPAPVVKPTTLADVPIEQLGPISLHCGETELRKIVAEQGDKINELIDAVNKLNGRSV